MKRMNQVLGCAALGVALSWTSMSWAGIPECANLRLEDVGSCEIQGNIQCEAGCSQLGVYKKACATKLRTVCSTECTLDAEPTCTDECTEVCTEQCDLGKNVVCIHNCFSECSGSCDADCSDAADPEQCVATCEANCDGECDIKCKPLVEGDCYKHCIECCGGSCTAQANMSCQQSCQEEEFESCEYEFRADCDASCTGEGALFCDGEYALSGTDLPSCGQALLARGISVADIEASAEIDTSELSDAVGTGCSTGSGPLPSSRWEWLGLIGVGLFAGRRRRARLASSAHSR